jgi:hypothetical protein
MALLLALISGYTSEISVSCLMDTRDSVRSSNGENDYFLQLSTPENCLTSRPHKRNQNMLQHRSVFRNLLLSAAHSNSSKTHNGTPQNVASRKGSTKLYMAINMYVHIATCPIRMQAYEHKILHMLNKTIDNGPMCVCVFICFTNSNYEKNYEKYCLFLTITC